jgi:hypothetical protein
MWSLTRKIKLAIFKLFFGDLKQIMKIKLNEKQGIFKLCSELFSKNSQNLTNSKS